MSALAVEFAGLHLHNPLMSASGCFGYGTEYTDYFDPNTLGAIVLKGLTLEKREGNAGVRIAETPSGMLNCIGLENVGCDVFEKSVLPRIRQKLHIPLIVNINGKTVEEYALLAERIGALCEIAALELNISCPNVKDGGMAFGTDPVRTAEVVRSVRKVCGKPLIVKLSPNVTDITEIAKAAEDEGADALSLINTLSGMAVNIDTQKPLLSNVTGGLSGPAVKPVALRMVYQVSQVSALPVIGVGGICSARDALEFILAGACAVAVGSAFFKNPLVAAEIVEGIRLYCTRCNTDIGGLTGRCHPDSGNAYRSRLSERKR